MNIHFKQILLKIITLIMVMGASTMTSQSAYAMDTKTQPGYTDGKFHMAVNPMTMGLSETLSTSWRFLFERNNQIPKTELPTQKADLTPFSHGSTGDFNSTWLGHSSLMINMDGSRILLDPVFEEKVSIVGPSRFNGPLPLAIEDLPPIDLVIISHDHYDHLNKYTVKALEKITQIFVVPMGVGKRLTDWGISGDKVIELNWWDSHELPASLKVTATPAQHFSGRGIFDRNKTLWASWVIESENFKIFFSGDSGYFDGFAAIGKAFGPFDMTFIECGAYDPTWQGVHMFPEETVQAHKDLGGKILHPIHWGTYKLALHPWFDPMERLAAAADKSDIPIATPMAGQTIDLNQRGRFWWKSPMEIAIKSRELPNTERIPHPRD